MKWFQLDALTTEDPRLLEIITKAGEIADGPSDEWRRHAVLGVLLATWCFTARQDTARPGYAEYSDRRPIAARVIAEAIRVDPGFFSALMSAAAALGHIDPDQWANGTIMFPAMVNRADTYTKRKREKQRDVRQAKVRKGPGSSRVRTQDTQSAAPVMSSSVVSGSDLLGSDRPQVDALVQLWNEIRTGPKVTGKLTETRKNQVGAALRRHPNLADWRVVIGWLNGQTWMNAPGTGTHPTWRATLDFLVKPGNMAKYLEQARLDQGPAGTRGRDASRGRTGFDRTKYDQFKGGGE